MWLIEKLFPKLVISKRLQILISFLIWFAVLLIYSAVVFFSGADWQYKKDKIFHDNYIAKEASDKAKATAAKQSTTDNFAASVAASQVATNVVYKTITKRKVEYVYKNASSTDRLDDEWVWIYNAALCGNSKTSCHLNGTPE